MDETFSLLQREPDTPKLALAQSILRYITSPQIEANRHFSLNPESPVRSEKAADRRRE
jgi:hypothetical protein